MRATQSLLQYIAATQVSAVNEHQFGQPIQGRSLKIEDWHILAMCPVYTLYCCIHALLQAAVHCYFRTGVWRQSVS